MSTAAHALTRVNPMPTGAVVACRCGWTQFVQPGDDATAKLAIKDHKAAAAGRKAATRQLNRQIAAEARRAATIATTIADGDVTITTARDLLGTVEALVSFIREAQS